MKRKLVVTLTLAAALGLILTLAIAFAQGPSKEEGEEQPGGAVGQFGLADPPTAGFSVVYMFTGVANDTTGSDQIATSVHCTNFGSTPTTIEVQFFTTSGALALPIPFTDTLSVNETTTYSTQPTLFNEFPLNAAIIEQGSGRILTKEHSQIICATQLLQPGSITPTFMARLPMFDRAGNPAGDVHRVFLPIILKP